MKVVINKCYGGFGISNEARLALIGHNSKLVRPVECDSNDRAIQSMIKHGQFTVIDGKVYTDDASNDENRTDKDLIEIVERLGEKANGEYAKLAIVEIPDGIEWEIDEYDGIESIEETHRSWS